MLLAWVLGGCCWPAVKPVVLRPAARCSALPRLADADARARPQIEALAKAKSDELTKV